MNEIIIDRFELAHGIEPDLDEGWVKIISRQFGGNPGRAIMELIQNNIDSYEHSVPMAERRGDIQTDARSITLTDFGSGFTREKVSLLVTLGGTDKANDPTKIGQFGIGFVSIFNPKLGTESVVVTTRCDGQTIRITFEVIDPQKTPRISYHILDEEIDFSTRICVRFKFDQSVENCLYHISKSLRYYPCKFTLNGAPFDTVWVQAIERGFTHFKDNHVDGFVEENGDSSRMEVLCKYEHVISISWNCLLSGSDAPKWDLRDYDKWTMPHIPFHQMVVNCNYLSLTISRDSFYLNYNYNSLVESIREVFYNLLDQADFNVWPQLVLANQYILRSQIASYLWNPNPDPDPKEVKARVIKRLAEFPLYRASGISKKLSLMDIINSLSDDNPLFYSPNKVNIRWLGGKFRHDLVLLPDHCEIEHGAPLFHETLFRAVFKDVVDLDTIQGNNDLIRSLVERGIVDPEMLSPGVKFIGTKGLKPAESLFLEEVNRLLAIPEIRNVIEANIYLTVSSIRAVFFEIGKEGAFISTGLFNQNETPWSENYVTNFIQKKVGKNKHAMLRKNDIILGLSLKHPLIRELIRKKDSSRAFYTLSYVAHELVMCQKMLVPYSMFFHFTKEKLAAGMRRALMNEILKKLK